MSRPDLFLDSSALFSGVVSSSGAARALLLLAEAELITITVSEQVIAETERALARKAPRAVAYYQEALRSTGLRIMRNPSPSEVEVHVDAIVHQADAPILVAAMKVETDYLVTFNRRHLIDDLGVGTSDDKLERTPSGIPVSLRPFFQEYVLEDLDPERSAFTVIERTLAWGDVPELRWLFAHYKRERLAEWVRQAGWRCLPRRRLKYWLCFFELSDYDHKERIWPH